MSKTYIAYRVQCMSAPERAGALLCRPHTAEEEAACVGSKYMHGDEYIFDADTPEDAWRIAEEGLCQ
jgi:hypothetical protein